MRTFSVTPLAADHFEERCRDLVRQARAHISETPLFMFKLYPEGRPVYDKAETYRALFLRYRDRLAPEGVRPAVLVQSTLGHGYPPDEPTDFQYAVSAADGTLQNSYCPLDPGIHDYMRSALAKVASYRPSYILIDDDFRLLGTQARGCVCERHMALFNRTAGTAFTRGEWIAYYAAHDETDPLVDTFRRTQRQSLQDLARDLRAGIDSVDPTIPGVACTAGALRDSQYTAPILAGRDNPVIVRGANDFYAPIGPLFFSSLLHRSAVSVQLYDGIADEVLSETDCIPYSRYGKSAAHLHAHYLGSLLEGMKGAKHWITRFTEYTPETGEPYREILGKNAGLYEKAAALAGDWHRLGCRIPTLPQKPWGGWSDNAFSECFFERIGVPFYTSGKPGGAACLSGPIGRLYTPAELAPLEESNLILASDAAEDIEKLGFGHLLGVHIQPWAGPRVSGERMNETDTCSPQMGLRALVSLQPETAALSVNFHRQGTEEVPLFPGVTLYRRPNGKYTAVCCGTPQAQHDYTQAFSFLCAARKQQFTALLRLMGELPVYYDGDAPVLLEAGTLPDGRMLLYLLNLGDDVLPAVSLVFEKTPAALARLNGEGQEEPVPCRIAGEKATLQRPLGHLLPELLLVSF